MPSVNKPALNWVRRHPLLVILIVGVGARLLVAIILGNQIEWLPGIADEWSYHSLAARLVDGNGFTFPTAWWPATRAGEPTAHWSYLYTVFLAGIYSVVRANPLAVRLIQAIIAGAVMPWLVYRVSRRVYTRVEGNQAGWINCESIALLAAAWMALYPYLVYYSAALMTETFYILAILWGLDCALRIEGRFPGRSRWFSWIELGIALVAALLLRQLFLLFVPFLLIWLAWSAWRGRRKITSPEENVGLHPWAGVLLTLAVIVGVIAPITWFNYRQFDRLVLLNTNAGYAFFWANHPIHGRKFVPILTQDMPSYQELIPQDMLTMNEAELDQELLKEGVKLVLTDPGRYLLLSLSRLPVYFQFWPSQQSSFFSNLARVFSLGLALPFSIFGVLLWGKAARKKLVEVEPGILLLSLILIYTLIHIFSWALIRYRLPLDPLLLIFAAGGVSWCYRKIIKSRPDENLAHPVPGSLHTD
jgi:hypothetical protein